MKKFLPVFIFLVACNTYDLPIVYKKNFQPGTHALLRFDGYYTDTLGPRMHDALNDVFGKPVFFYSEGSAFATEINTSRYSVSASVKNKSLNGSWGNYKINADTILFERFHLVTSNYRRVILKGILSKDRIRWISRKDHTEEYKPVDYTLFFVPSADKPDSTQNWTRKRKKYNQ